MSGFIKKLSLSLLTLTSLSLVGCGESTSTGNITEEKPKAKLVESYISPSTMGYMNARPTYNYYVTAFSFEALELYSDNTAILTYSYSSFSAVILPEEGNDATGNERNNLLIKYYTTYTRTVDDIDDTTAYATLAAPTRIVSEIDSSFYVDTANWDDTMKERSKEEQKEYNTATGQATVTGTKYYSTGAEYLEAHRYKNENLKFTLDTKSAAMDYIELDMPDAGIKTSTNTGNERMPGNADEYDVNNVKPLESSPLEGKNICYLGSSVTYGASSLGESFVEFIAKRNKTTYVKEAVSGTTLTTNGTNDTLSYIPRMKKLDKNTKFDLFVCQLSTNDASQNKHLGNSDSKDETTVCGAINTIIDYAKDTWNCPVMFYTNAYYKNDNYAKMVTALKEISTKKDIGVIDLYTDEAFNNITDKERQLYMADSIHPTKAGYLKWWTPKMEEVMYDYLG